MQVNFILFGNVGDKMRDEYHLVTVYLPASAGVPKIFWVRMRIRDSKWLIAKKSSILMGDWCSEDVIDTLPKK